MLRIAQALPLAAAHVRLLPQGDHARGLCQAPLLAQVPASSAVCNLSLTAADTRSRCRYGGLYLDLDMESLRPVDELLADHRLLLAAIGDNATHEQSINNCFMASQPGEPFWLFYVQAMQTRAALGFEKVCLAPCTPWLHALCNDSRRGLRCSIRLCWAVDNLQRLSWLRGCDRGVPYHLPAELLIARDACRTQTSSRGQ